MPNRLTRVPDRPVPPLPALGRLLTPAADAFMILMVSRPASGSLRTTWVTPASLGLGAALALLGLPLAALALRSGVPLAVAGGVALLLLGLGAAAVAVVGLLQRR